MPHPHAADMMEGNNSGGMNGVAPSAPAAPSFQFGAGPAAPAFGQPPAQQQQQPAFGFGQQQQQQQAAAPVFGGFGGGAPAGQPVFGGFGGQPAFGELCRCKATATAQAVGPNVQYRKSQTSH